MTARTPQDIARETVKLLTARKLPPTPDNFKTIYHEVAGTKALQPFPLDPLRQIASALPDKTPAQQRIKRQISQAITMHSWESLQKVLLTYLSQASGSALPTQEPESAAIEPPKHLASTGDTTFPPAVLEQMARIVDNALPAVGNDDDKLVEQARDLVVCLRQPHPEGETLRQMMSDFGFRLSFVAEDQALIRSTLLALLHLVFENITTLSPEHPWLQEQMDTLMKAASPPLSVRRLEDLERQLKNVIFKQREATERSHAAREVMKNALSGFITRLGQMTDQSDHYQEKIERIAQELQSASDLAELAPVLQEAIDATRAMVIDTQRASEEMHLLRERTTQAEAEIARLQEELDRISSEACHDMLTGVLNRKGLEEVVERELSRAQRINSCICLALLDIDDFKKINDQHGHDTGDAALKHLADVARLAMRPTDSVARYGGEEFVLVLPDTALEEGVEVVRRLQRELTTAYFMREQQRLLITFSAGVTQVGIGESHQDALTRADQAMYLAKRSGKNRVVGA